MALLQRTTARPPGAILLVALAAVLLAGCGDARRQSVEGTVTLDGKPLSEGCIKFIPREGTAGPTAGATIRDGRFSVDPTKGTFAGSFRVEILATRPSGRFVTDPVSGEKIALCEQYLPARYNAQSELTAEIGDGQPAELRYDLASK